MSLVNTLRRFMLQCGAVLALLILASCGGANDGGASLIPPLTPDEKKIEVAKTHRHTAALGLLAGATVEVRDAFDKGGTVVFTTTTDNDGLFSVTLPEYNPGTIYLVTVSGGRDLDVRDTGTRDAEPTPSKGSISALVDASDLLAGAVRVTWLSDAAYRMIGGDLSRFDKSTLNLELNRVARALLSKSVLGGDAPVSADLLHFDATVPEHRTSLAFDAQALWAPREGDGKTLIDLYHEGSEEVATVWRDVTANVPGLVPTAAEEADRPTLKIQVKVSGVGRLDSSLLPNGQLGSDTGDWSAVLPKDGSTSYVQAVETTTGWVFDSWVGCTRVRGNRCELDMTEDLSVSARFALEKPTVKPEVKSLGRIAPADGLTGIRVQDGVASFITRDPEAAAFLRTVEVGTLIQTGQRDHPTVRVKRIVSRPTEVAANATEARTVAMTTLAVEVEDASPLDVYDEVSIVANSTPMAFDEVKAITLSDGVGGQVRTVLPPPDFTSSVVEGTVLGNAPTWYVSYATDGRSCRGYGSDATARAALQAAWQDDPRGYPFTQPALANCVGLGNFTIGGDLTDYVMGKSMGETDQLSGRHDGTGKLAMRAPKQEADTTHLAKLETGRLQERRGEPVWVSGLGIAVPVGNDMYLAAREDAPGLRLVALDDVKSITTAAATRQARSDCSMHGLSSACALIAGMERERRGLRSVGLIPLLSTPISVTLTKPGSNFSGTISLSFNIEINPYSNFSWSLGSQWVRASAGATYKLAPELGLTASYGRSTTGYVVPNSSKTKKFDRNTSKKTTDANKINVSKPLITIDLGRAIPYAGAVLDLSLNLVLGVDVGGDVSITVTPKITMTGDFGMSAYYEYRVWRSSDRVINAWLNMAPPQPSIKVQAKGTLMIEPYAEVNIAAGLRGVAPEVAKAYVRAGFLVRGEVATGFSFGDKMRIEKGPDVWTEGPVKGDSKRYWEDCSLATRVSNAGSCSCTGDQVQNVWVGWFYMAIPTRKCTQRGVPALVPGVTRQIPQRCFDSPEIALGAYIHARAGAKTSSNRFAWPFNGWLNFINRDFAFFDKEWPIWEYPQRDNQPQADLAGCRDI